MLAALPAVALEVIVSREGEAISVYLRMPFEDVKPLFGRFPPGFADEEGNVRYSDLSQGTFDGADILAENMRFTLGGQSVGFEAMSMMVHMEGFDVPFLTPLDGLTAIGVCGVPIPDAPPQPEDLVWIGGWYAYPVKAAQDIEIIFPQTGRPDVDLQLRVYDQGEFEMVETLKLHDGMTLDLPARKLWWQRLLGQ